VSCHNSNKSAVDYTCPVGTEPKSRNSSNPAVVVADVVVVVVAVVVVIGHTGIVKAHFVVRQSANSEQS